MTQTSNTANSIDGTASNVDYWMSWLKDSSKWLQYGTNDGMDLVNDADGLLPGDISVKLAAAIEAKAYPSGGTGGLSGHDKLYLDATTPLKTVAARDPNGLGNNIAHPTWGKADQSDPTHNDPQSEFLRLTPAHYADGKGQLETFFANPRDISNKVLAIDPTNGNDLAAKYLNTHDLNENIAFFGQFLTHDLDEATPFAAVDANGATIPTGTVLISTTDPDGSRFVFPLARDNFVTDANGVRQQVTDVTAYADLSDVYGSSKLQQHLIRAVDSSGHDTAKLIVDTNGALATVHDVINAHAEASSLFLDHPTDTLLSANQKMIVVGPGSTIDNSYYIGDFRINQNAELTAESLVWVKEHNYQVDQLSNLHPDWTQEQLFNAARAITTAEYQHIVYDEYLTHILGKGTLEDYDGYKKNVNATISTEFAGAAFRFGHDEQSNELFKVGADGKVIDALTLAQAFSTATKFANGSDFDALMRGLTSEHGQQVDGQVQDGVRQQLFNIPGLKLDLEAIDIARGYDLGLGRGNEVRAALHMDQYTSYLDMTGGNQSMADKLKAAYGSDAQGHDNVNNVDLMIMGMVEKHINGGELGQTFSYIVADQFERTRDGDRLFYLNQFKDDPKLLAEINSTTFSDILSRTTGEKHWGADAFLTYNRIVVSDANSTVHGNQHLLNPNDTNTNDLFVVTGGTHTLYGDGGKDTFAFDRSTGANMTNAKIADFHVASNTLDLTTFGINDYADLVKHSKQMTIDTKVSTVISNDHGDQIALIGVKLNSLTTENVMLNHGDSAHAMV